MRRAALGALIAILLPVTAMAQEGKHVAVGMSFGSHDFADHRFDKGSGVFFLYRLRTNGTEENGFAFGPSATVGVSRADVADEATSGNVTLGRFRSIPVMAGGGVHYRHNAWWTGLSLTAGASFNSVLVDQEARTAYAEQLGQDLEAVDANTAFAAQPGLSVWYDVGSRVGLYGGAAYFYSRPKALITVDGVTTEETWKADYLGLSVGAVFGLF